MPPIKQDARWPEIPYAPNRETCATLQLWSQMVGKIRLARTPWLNHSWHVTLYVSARGLTTSPIPDGSRVFEIEFDFLDHRLEIRTSDGQRGQSSFPPVAGLEGPQRSATLTLAPRSVADFYAELRAKLAALEIAVTINERPCEIAGALPFSQDRVHAAYDAGYVRALHGALRQADRVFKQFRTGFVGKASPVHFFWGSFDLAVTRFSGRPAPPLTRGAPGVAPEIMREAYSHEVSSAGFWPGGSGVEEAAFYAYAYPEPAGFRSAPVRPGAAFYHEALGQFILPYDAVRTAADPDAALLDFLQSTYEAAAHHGAWDRAALEGPMGQPGVVRATPAPPK